MAKQTLSLWWCRDARHSVMCNATVYEISRLEDAPLVLAPYLVRVPLSHVVRLLHQRHLDSLPGAACARPPTGHGPLTSAPCSTDRVPWTAVHAQGPPKAARLCRELHALAPRALGRTQRLMAQPLEEPRGLPRVDTKVALASLASGRARARGTTYGCGVRDCPPGGAGEHPKRRMFGPPCSFQAHLPTV